MTRKVQELQRITWDSEVFGIDCFELSNASKELLHQATTRPGHYAVKVDPLSSKEALHQHGFYYCDTLIEPCCRADDLIRFEHEKIALDRSPDLDLLLPMCRGTFTHGRFHRDFHLDQARADERYAHWLTQLHKDNGVFGLRYEDQVVGFIGCAGNRLVLHALAERWRGRGLAKYFWSSLCDRMFAEGAKEISSSISATNLAALNLYARLGFKFRSPVDVYHRLVRK